MRDINLFRVKNSIYLKRVSSKSEILKEDSCDGYLIEGSESEARRIIESVKGRGKIIAVVGRDDIFNRRIAEHLRIDFLVSPEKFIKIDNLKQRDSGMNHVVAKILVKNKISLVINMNEILKLRGAEMSLRIARIIQNIKICRKVGCRVLVGSFAEWRNGVIDELGRKSFVSTLGMSTDEVCESILFNKN